MASPFHYLPFILWKAIMALYLMASTGHRCTGRKFWPVKPQSFDLLNNNRSDCIFSLAWRSKPPPSSRTACARRKRIVHHGASFSYPALVKKLPPPVSTLPRRTPLLARLAIDVLATTPPPLKLHLVGVLRPSSPFVATWRCSVVAPSAVVW